MLGFHGEAGTHFHTFLMFCLNHFAVAWPPWPIFCEQGHSAPSVLYGHPCKAVGVQHAPRALPLQNGDAARVLRSMEIPITGRGALQDMLWKKPKGTCWT